MRRSSCITLVLITLFILSLASPYNLATDTSLVDPSVSESGLIAEGGTAYTGVGSALDVSFTGSFVNASAYSDTGSTLSNMLTPGVSYSVENATTVTWTANVLVSPPAEVAELSFSVSYPVTDWKVVSVTDPLGVDRTNPAEWYVDYDDVIVRNSAVDTYGVWTLTFTAVNHIDDLEMGPSGGPYTSLTTTFDTGDTMRFGITSSWITGASAEFDLIDPTGSIWYSSSNSTVGATTHLLSSFRYRKDITIHNGWVTGDFTDFPVLIDILDTDLHDDVQADADDIVFVSNDIILSHEIELFNQAYNPTQGHLVAWVKANLSSSTDTIISMYYGNPVVGPQSDPESVWSSSYSSVWHLGEDATDEGTSTDHLDSTSGDYYGDQVGNEDVTGIFGTGQSFDGINDEIIVDAARGLEPVGDVTFSGWFKLDTAVTSTPGPTQVILTKAIDADDDMHIAIAGSDYLQSSIPNGSLVFKIENNGGSNQRYVWSLRTTWAADTWYYFTCTMYSATPTLNAVYVNGIDNTDTSTGNTPYANVTFTDDWVIGGGFMDQMSPKDDNGWFEGTIDELRISNTIRSSQWINTEYLMSSSSFRTLASESTQTSPDMYIDKALNITAPSGLWTVSAHYNDSGSSVSHRVGEYQRNFIVRRASTLSIESPSDAASGLESLIVGDMLYLVVDLSDANSADPAIGATVSMNWTVSGVGTTEYFEDLGDGRYSIARNTSELSDRMRWRIEIDSTHPYYFDASDSFNLDIFHTTQLTYESVSTTPTGFDFTATLVYRDTWDNSLISGATITFGDGSPVTVLWEGGGEYNISIPTGALSKGLHSYTFNATNTANLYDMASVDVTFTLRNHYTSVTVTGNLVTAYGEPTSLTIVITDLDTGTTLSASDVSSFLIDPASYGNTGESNPSDLIVDLDTSSWSVATETVTLSLVMTGNYYNPSNYVFNVQIRDRLTSITVIGNLETPYGNITSLTIVITDLDSGTTLSASDISSFSFSSSYGSPGEAGPSDLLYDLDTSSWDIGGETVTLSVVMNVNYQNPTDYVFTITIRTLDTTLYNAPSNLLFTQGSDFTIDIHFNVSEAGPFYGDSINGEVGQFVVAPYGGNITALGDGMYRVTISWSIFEGQGTTDFTIDIDVTPSSSLYASASLVVSFQYRAIISDLTANLYTVSTPYNMDVTIHLYFTDRDSGTGITTADITTDPDIIISGPHVSNGDYLVTLDSSTLTIGSHAINLTATASGYETKWVIVTIIITQIHTDAEPSTIRLEIPSGNTEIFFIDWTDLDNSLAIQTAIINIADNWNGTAPVIVWTGTQYQITFETTTSDSLGTYLLWFNFTKGAEYQPGYCEIQVEIRSHDTILTSDSPPPTAFNSLINISVYYYDFDNKIGIHDLVNVQEYVFEGASPIASSLIVVGSGYYTVQIDASTVGLGLHNFTVYINWTGAIQQYANKFVFVSVNVVGVDSQMTLITASDPSAYLETMTYTFLYSEKDSGTGITNSTDQGYGTGNVHISVSFDVAFNPSMLTISEVGGGIYQIDIDTTGFGQIGQFSMTITIDWDPVDPFYSVRDDTVSVLVLPRDTLLLVNPPSPVSFGEDATFTFWWEDTALSSNIAYSALEMDIVMDVTFGYVHNSGIFTVTIDTTQFGDMGTYVMTLDLTWDGAPFYANRTSQISITVLARQTTLDYPTPDPTFYSDNVTITITWTDVTNGASDGILDATIRVFEEGVEIPSNEYDVRNFTGGVYEIEFSTSRFATTGLWNITIEVSIAETYIISRARWQYLDVRQRITILSYEAIGKVAYNDSIGFVIYFDDLYTSTIIGNGTGDVTLEILTAGTWVFTSTWNAVDERYDIVITSYPEYSIGVPIDIEFRMTFANIAPFYAPDDVTATFELRERLSLLSLEIAPNPAPYLDDATFSVRFMDVDADFGINGGYIWVYYGMTNLSYGSEYTYTPLVDGYYDISVNSTALGGIGQWSLSVDAYWTSGAPYHNNASATVNIRVTTRDTIVDITVPPSQTSFLDDVTFTFEYTDLFRGTAITSILTSDISLYNNGSLVDSGDYSLTPSGSRFIFTVDSETLGPTLGRYNLTIIIDWNEATSPYYVDAQSTTWVTVTTRTLSFALDPLDETSYGDLLNITFTLTDMSTGATVDGADITFASQTLSLFEGVDYNIIPAGSGVYIIRVDTVALGSPGDFLFDLDIAWDVGTSPYYRSLNTIVLTGVISDIETLLNPLSDQVTVLWKVSAPISVDYQNLLWMNFTTGATVTWTWPGVDVGNLTETGFTGVYTTGIDTSVTDAGTYVITIKASKNNFEDAYAYITLVVQSLPSDISPIDPPLGSIAIPRGSGLNVTIYFEDVTNVLPIPVGEIVGATATFEGFVYDFVYDGIAGQWTVEIPANGPTIQPQGAYSLLIQASFNNFEPSSYIINIELQASSTEIILTGDTDEDMAVTYSESALFTVNLTKPDFGDELFPNADLRWSIEEKGWYGNFTTNGDGSFYVNIDTIALGFGIWPVKIYANVWDNSSEFTDTSTSLTLTITRIQTDVIRPTNLEVAWGWTGNLTFIYNGTFGPIENAYVEYTGEILVGVLYELANGTYLVEVDTTLASPGIFTVTMTFQKENYQEAPVGIQFVVAAAQTEISIDSVTYTPTYEDVLEDFLNLQIPIGDSVTIEFFFNDTDDGNDFVGGLSGAISTYNSYLRGESIPSRLNVTVIDLGNGLYRVTFDTTDAEIGAIVSSEAYRMYIEMSLDNRTNAEILFRITVIDIPTELTILGAQSTWNFTNGESLTIELLYMDTWHDSGIADAYFSANASTGAPFTVTTALGSTPGQYFVTINADGIKLTPGSGTVTIVIGDGTYTVGGGILIIELSQNGTDILATNAILYGLPGGLIILMLGLAYVRVWNVPKRLRQINSQIKTIRKGKIPKPVTEAKSRQDLIADLFNDTYSQVEIVRTPEQMPPDSIPVDVPELGELLIQLAILTNLDQQELDDFKADIAKMKISEQAAFVKEVIVQEAIRAGRREHKTVEQILEDVEAQASKRIAGEGEAVVVEDGVEPVETEPDVDTVILPDTDETTVSDTDVPSETVTDETIPSDRLSPFEIEELKKDLEAKGVPLHEIDTILKQAQELPRDLVEELIRSLDRSRGT